MNDNAKEFELNHKVGFLTTPENIAALPTLTASGMKFYAPNHVDLMDFCTKTEDQGSKPWCAAYSAAGFTENILWRKNDYPCEINPSPIYQYAKSIDGDPNGSGTTLTAVLDALLHYQYFDKSICKIKTIRNLTALKYAIHKYGCALAGFSISREWYSLNSNKTAITGKSDKELIGGHATLVCGFNKDGLFIQNSWGEEWGNFGFGLITWEEAQRQFMYGAVLTRCLDGLDMNC